MNERKTEIAILRMLGASPAILLLLILFETVILVSLAIITPAFILTLILFSFESWLTTEVGLFLSDIIFTIELMKLMSMIFLVRLIVSLIPEI